MCWTLLMDRMAVVWFNFVMGKAKYQPNKFSENLDIITRFLIGIPIRNNEKEKDAHDNTIEHVVVEILSSQAAAPLVTTKGLDALPESPA